MWPYTTDEQVWLEPAKNWIAARGAAEAQAPRPGAKPQAPAPVHDMPAPYDSGISDPQVSA